jgi:hypothetical protein
VRKIGEQDWSFNGITKRFYYVRTEFGLRYYIPPENLAPLDRNKVYLFADAPEPVPYCVGGPICKPEKTTIHVLQANLRYAVAIPPVPNLQSCDPIHIETFNVGGGATGEKNAFVRPCVKDPVTKQLTKLGSLQVITFSDAVEQLNSPIEGNFEGTDANLVSRLVNGSVLEKKDCGDPLKYETTLSTEAKAQMSLYAVEGSFGTSYVEDFVKELNKDNYYLFSAYSRLPLSPSSETKETIHDLTYEAKCENDEPSEGLSITLFDDRFTNGSLVITTAQLRRTYLSSFGLRSYSPITLNDLAIEDANELKDGKFWRVRGVAQYLRWRTLLRDYVLHADPVQDILNDWPPEKKQWVAEFYAHIILASSFDFGSPDDGGGNK